MSKSPFRSPLALLGAGALLVASLPFVQACIDETPATTNTGGASTGGASTGGASTGGASGSDSGGTTATGGSVAGGGMTGGTETGGSSGSDVGGAGAGGLAGAAGTVAGGGAGGFAGSSGDAGAGGKAGAGGSLGGMSGSGGIGGASGGAGGKAGGGGSGGMIAIGGSGSYVRTGWTAEYTCTGGDCPPKSAADMGDVATRAFDNSFTTRWSTGVYQSALATQNRFPLYFTVDMKQVTNVSRITTHPGCQDIFDSPGTVEVYLSLDGANFGTAVTTMPHVPAVPPNEPCPPSATAVATDSITFPTTPARFIQLKATRRTTSDRYWAIGELNVYP